MLEFYERLAIKLKPFGGYLAVACVIVFIASLYYQSESNWPLSITLFVVMGWLFGLVLLVWNYGPTIKLREFGEREYIGKMREQPKFMIMYSNIFMAVWFVMLFFLTIVVARLWLTNS